MLDVGLLYFVTVGVLLLVALGLGLRVLRGIVQEARTRRRQRRAGEAERYTEDEEYGRNSPDVAEEDDGTPSQSTCRKCGTENDPGFRYCRRCTTPL